MVVLLRAILPNTTVKKKFICEWCKDLKKSVLGFASHVKKCAIEQKVTNIFFNSINHFFFMKIN